MHHRLTHLRHCHRRTPVQQTSIPHSPRTNQLVRHHAAGIEHRQLAVPFLCRLCHSDHSFRHSHQTETGNICRRFTLLQLFPALVFQPGQAAVYAPYHRFDPERFPALPGKLFQCLAAGKLQSQHQPHPIDRLSGFQIQRGTAGGDLQGSLFVRFAVQGICRAAADVERQKRFFTGSQPAGRVQCRQHMSHLM